MLFYTQADKDGIISARFVYTGKSEINDFSICFSLLSKCSAVSGCKLTRQVGGYTELTPEHSQSLKKGQEWEFSFKYELDRHGPVNKSWGPKGTYLKLNNGKTLEVISEPLEFLNTSIQSLKQITFEEPKLRLIPHPVLWEMEDGTCDISRGINFSNNISKKEGKVILTFKSLLERNGYQEIICDGGILVCFENVKQKFGEEGYELTIKPELLKISASHYAGFFYALISLLQMRETYNALIPCGKVEDRPRFSWRGQHLDCARHFYQVDSILSLLDLMSLLKLNRFHWHLIDDEAFRLELSSVPELAARTGMRGDGCTIPGVFGGGKGPTGGTYSAEDVARIIEHASSLGISVMPEIEIPAHSLALIKVIPEMRDSEDRSCEESVQGYSENTINPAMPATWEFLGKVIPEVCILFPFGVIHLGCDELPVKLWKKSPAIEKLKKKEGLKTTEDVLEWTMQKVAKILVEAGGRPAAWEEAGRGQNGGIGNDALLFSWTGLEPGLKAARKGYEVVMCPAQHVYFDMAHSSEVYEAGVSWAAFISIADALEWEPVPVEEAELVQRVIGIQGGLWSETIIRDRDMESMLAPRILALSEGAWSTPSRKRKLTEFMGAARYFEKIFDQLDWECHGLV